MPDKVLITKSKLDSLANAISEKSGEPLPMTLAEMEDAVEGIPSGGTTWETVYNGTVDCYDATGTGYYGAYINDWDGGTIDLNSVWRVTWDSVQYECTATWYNTDGDPYALGNYTYDGGSGGTEYPFMFQVYWSNTGVVIGSSGNHTFKLEKQVSGGGSTGLEYETGTYTPTEDVASDQVTISFANSHTEEPIFIVMVDTGAYYDTTYSQHYWNYANHYLLFGNPIYSSTTSAYYAQGYNRVRASNATSMTGNAINYSSQSDSRVSNENFKPYYSSSYYYRSGRTYKWIAVWAPST